MNRALLVKALKFVKECSGLIYYNNLDLDNFDESAELEELRELFSKWIKEDQWTEEQKVLMREIINAENTFAGGTTKQLIEIHKDLSELDNSDIDEHEKEIKREELKERLKRALQESDSKVFSTSLGDKTKEELLSILNKTNLGKVVGEGINLINIPERFIIKINIR